jgi:sugar (glycoside-pentoside-hexuronide) transporter
LAQAGGGTTDFKTGTLERFSYGFYFFGQLIFYIFIVNFLQLYMTDAGIPATVVGAVFIVAKIWDAINDPIFGVIVDKAHLKSGKYIPWVRLSSFLIPLTTIFLFSVPLDVSLQVKVIWVAIGYVLWDTSYTICDVPIFALATSMTDNLKERDWLYLLNRFFMFVGGILAIILVPLLYPNIGWMATAIILSVLAMITMLPIGYKAKERYFTDAEKNPKISELLRYLGKNKQLLIFNGALIIASLTGTGVVATNYVAIYCLGGTQWITVMGLVMALPMLIAIIVTQQIIKKIDKFVIYLTCTGVTLLMGVVMFFVGYQNITLFLSIIALRSVFASAGGVLIVMFTADCAEYGHFLTGERAQGVAFSIQTFTAKITAALAGAIGMFILGAVGFIEGEGAVQTADTISWLWRMYTIIPVIAGTVSFLIIFFGYKLRRRDVESMMSVNAGEISREEAMGNLSKKVSAMFN